MQAFNPYLPSWEYTPDGNTLPTASLTFSTAASMSTAPMTVSAATFSA